MDIREFQGYAYFFTTVAFVVGLYWYIVYLYKGKDRGVDYEKYSDLALNDNLDDEILEDNREKKSDK